VEEFATALDAAPRIQIAFMAFFLPHADFYLINKNSRPDLSISLAYICLPKDTFPKWSPLETKIGFSLDCGKP